MVRGVAAAVTAAVPVFSRLNHCRSTEVPGYATTWYRIVTSPAANSSVSIATGCPPDAALAALARFSIQGFCPAAATAQGSSAARSAMCAFGLPPSLFLNATSLNPPSPTSKANSTTFVPTVHAEPFALPRINASPTRTLVIAIPPNELP
jgi:hypothetical protein